ncbi:SRPBCC family protein [Streptomyces sp. NPDC006539]|uniref:SRPBCC family protein n=1 Tax=Streptomyces sp. NPDC006539 TaxID=3155352 RepID=UPI0033A73F85
MAGKEREAQGSGAGGLSEALSGFAEAQVGRLAEKASDKLKDVTEQLTDAAESGSLLKVGSRVLGGESPVKAFLSEKAKGVKDSVVGKVKEAFGGGKGKGKSGSSKSMNIIEVLDVGVPLRTAYDYWTQYEDFSSFTKGVRSVSMTDEMSSNWKVKVGPSSRGFKATVLEQIPDDRIVWTSEGAKGTTKGAVSFHELAPTLTRIVLVMEYYPSGFFEKTGNIWRAQGRRVRLDFKHFQRYVTLTGDEPEGWRGEIRDGEVVVSHEEAMEEEEAAQAEDSESDDEYEDADDGDAEDEEEDEGEDEGEDEEEDDGEDEEEDDGEDLEEDEWEDEATDEDREE